MHPSPGGSWTCLRSSLGVGDHVHLGYNYLNLSPGTKVMADIQTLISKGVTVIYEPQNPAPVPVKEASFVGAIVVALILAVRRDFPVMGPI